MSRHIDNEPTTKNAPYPSGFGAIVLPLPMRLAACILQSLLIIIYYIILESHYDVTGYRSRDF